jgi:hypothetical protein
MKNPEPLPPWDSLRSGLDVDHGLRGPVFDGGADRPGVAVEQGTVVSGKGSGGWELEFSAGADRSLRQTGAS